MKVLITGGSGFLGRQVMKRLLSDDRIEKVYLVSRKTDSSSISPKVVSLQVDLTDKRGVDTLPWNQIDRVIHLAGNYDFHSSPKDNYILNVLATEYVIRAVKEANKTRHLPFYFASTFAVLDPKREGIVDETPLNSIELSRISYSTTKSMAELSVSKSGVPSVIFRLGVLVGDTERGVIDRMDGPYFLLKWLTRLSKLPGHKHWSKLVPYPVRSGAILPLVPVDRAAEVIFQALFKETLPSTPARIIGVYHPESASADVLVRDFQQALLGTRETTLFPYFPDSVMRLQSKITGIPENVFRYTLYPTRLSNPNFREYFPETPIPHYRHYREVLLSGFHAYSKGKNL